jgi:hypothetical protein
MRENPDLALDIENKVREAAALTPVELGDEAAKSVAESDGAQSADEEKAEENSLELDLMKEVA